MSATKRPITSGAIPYLPFFFCERADPAAVFDFFEVRPSLSTDEAAVAAFLLVLSFVAFDCVSALPAEVFDLLPVFFDLRTIAAAFAAFGRVCFDFAISTSPLPLV